MLERPHRVDGEVTGDGSMEPERSTLLPVQSKTGADPARERFYLTPAKASLFWAPLTGQQPSIAQVHDVLPGRPEDRRCFAGADEFMVVHVGIAEWTLGPQIEQVFVANRTAWRRQCTDAYAMGHVEVDVAGSHLLSFRDSRVT